VVRSIAGMFSMINVTIIRDASWCRAVIVIRLAVCLNQTADGGRSRNKGNRDWRSYKSSQREHCEERPDTGSDTFGKPAQHCLALRRFESS
jgi:hypothetical protein